MLWACGIAHRYYQPAWHQHVSEVIMSLSFNIFDLFLAMACYLGSSFSDCSVSLLVIQHIFRPLFLEVSIIWSLKSLMFHVFSDVACFQQPLDRCSLSPKDHCMIPSRLQHTSAVSCLPASCCTEGGRLEIGLLETCRNTAGAEHISISCSVWSNYYAQGHCVISLAD